ncbi:MAG: hypothetical protein QG552_2061 [Thermodesulfobacteriota bacterium]|nr:hypothetical protein [Thermodesulfobacteriota bacterium]
MEALYSKELVVPLYQAGLMLVLSTLVFLFVKARVALMIHYLFVLYWVYWLNRDAVLGKGAPSIDLFSVSYYIFGLVIIILAVIGFLNRPE